MNKKTLFYIYQFGIIVAIFIVLLVIFRFLFDYQSDWTEGIIAAITAVITLMIDAAWASWQKRKRQDKLQELNLSQSKENNFGIDGFSFYDHDDRGYIPELITLKTGKTYVYDTNKSFKENASVFPKLEAILNFINTKSAFQRVNLEEMVKEIVHFYSLDSIAYDADTLLVNKLAKSRKDMDEDRKEASVLEIQLIKSNQRTKVLIDTIFDRLKAIDPRTMTASYKTEERPNLEDNYIDELLCFITSLNMYVGVISNQNIKVNDKNLYHIWYNQPPYGIHIPIDQSTFENSDGNITGKQLANNVLNYVEHQLHFSHKKELPHITDVAFSFAHGMTTSLLCAAIIDDNVEDNHEFRAIQDTVDDAHRFSEEIAEDDYPRLFYFSYLLSVVRKIENHRF